MLKQRLTTKHAQRHLLLRRCEQVHVPIRILGNRLIAKRSQTTICYFEQRATPSLQSVYKLKPVRARLLQAIWPKLKEQFCVCVIGQDTTGTEQRLELISLNIHFD